MMVTESETVAVREPTVAEVLACAALIVLAVVIGVAGGAIVLVVGLVALFVGGAGVGLFLLAVALWERAGR
jgi:hypothetical protein